MRPRRTGYGAANAPRAGESGAAVNVGTIVEDARLIASSLVITALSLLWVRHSIGGSATWFYSIFGTGLLLGFATSTKTLMAAFYPTKIRATGVGSALGIGRVGAALGPASAGLIPAYGFSPSAIFQSMGWSPSSARAQLSSSAYCTRFIWRAATRPSNFALTR